METPYTDHLTMHDYEHVYEPAEDSFLLLDALEDDVDYLMRLNPAVLLEIGSGSGVIITALAKVFKSSLCMSTDINIDACGATKRTATRNYAYVDAVRCNLVDGIRNQSVDILVFNPPYVVTSDVEFNYSRTICSNAKAIGIHPDLVYTWAGGVNGRRVIDAILESLDSVLSTNGVFYLLCLQENKPEEIIDQLRQLGFHAVKFKERRIPGEYLYILKVIRNVEI